jgi:hypothetical protein
LPAAPEADRSNRLGVSEEHKPNGILWRELDAQCRPQRAEAECMQVLVEVTRLRRQGKRLNARSFGAFGNAANAASPAASASRAM